MKRILGIVLALSVVTASYAAPSSVSPGKKDKLNASEVFVPLGKTGHKISLMELSTIKAKDLEKLTGKKMKLSEKVAFKVAQKRLASNIEKDGTINAKKMEGVAKKSKFASEQSRKYLRIWLLLLGAAIILSILGIFLPFLWIISALAGLGATIFFILWLIALADS